MKIAFMGSRGIPARYSGFETFYEELGTRLASRGHQVTVYNRSHFIRDVRGTYKGVRLVTLPSIPTKHLDTISHTLLSSLHALTQRYDIAYLSIVGNSPLAWIPRLAGSKVLLNVDGADWAREKWGRFARGYQLWCEKVATQTAQVIIADAREVQRRYREAYDAESLFVPYGANLQHEAETDLLARWGLEPGRYIFYVGRFVPENAIDVLIHAFKRVSTDMKLVITGDAPYMEDYKNTLRNAAADDPRILFTGYAFGKEYRQLSSHAFFYVQPSGVDGTRPALLDQMGFGNCVVVRDSAANLEVIRDAGYSFSRHDPESSLASVLQDLVDHPDKVEAVQGRARDRIAGYYNWDWITDFYEDLFRRLIEKRKPVCYDEFLTSQDHGNPADKVPTGDPSPSQK